MLGCRLSFGWMRYADQPNSSWADLRRAGENVVRPRIPKGSWVRGSAFLGLLVLIALSAAEAHAQQPAKVRQIGYLIYGSAASVAHRTEALRMGLRDLGYVEGKNIAIAFRSAETADRLPEAAADLVRLKVDVIFATSSTEVEAARRATDVIPIVFATHADPERLGHVASLARPGGNITGLTLVQTEVVAKGLEIMKQALPRMTRVGVLLTATAPSHHPSLRLPPPSLVFRSLRCRCGRPRISMGRSRGWHGSEQTAFSPWHRLSLGSSACGSPSSR